MQEYTRIYKSMQECTRIYISLLLIAYIELTEDVMETVNIATGFLNTIQWVVAAIFPALFVSKQPQ